MVIAHYSRGNHCVGSGALPIEQDYSALRGACEQWMLRERRLQAIYDDHRDRRLNAPLEASFWHQWSDACSEANRLSRRLTRALRAAIA